MADKNHTNKQPTTNLNEPSNITAVQTDIDVDSNTDFPTAPFTIQIGSELMDVTSTGSGTDWTVVREQYGSTATTHNDNAEVRYVVVHEDWPFTKDQAANTYAVKAGASVQGQYYDFIRQDKSDPFAQRTDLDFHSGMVVTDETAGTDYHDALDAYTLTYHLPLDTSATDRTGNKTFTTGGSPTFSTAGAPTLATTTSMDLDADGDYLTSAYDAAWLSGTHIIWYKGTDTGTQAVYDSTSTLMAMNTSSVAKRWGIQIDNSGNAFGFIGDNYVEANGTSAINDDAWHMIAVVLNGSGTMSLYVDGVLEDSATDNAGSSTPALYIGYDDRNNNGAIGQLAEACHMTEQLDASQLAALYAARLDDPGTIYTRVKYGVDEPFSGVWQSGLDGGVTMPSMRTASSEAWSAPGSATTSTSVTVPSGADAPQSGDLMVLYFTIPDRAESPAAPTGYTLLRNKQFGAGERVSISVWTRESDGTEAGNTVTVTHSFETCVLTLRIYKDVDTTLGQDGTAWFDDVTSTGAAQTYADWTPGQSVDTLGQFVSHIGAGDAEPMNTSNTTDWSKEYERVGGVTASFSVQTLFEAESIAGATVTGGTLTPQTRTDRDWAAFGVEIYGSSSANSSPPAGRLTNNNATASLITKLWLNKTDANSVDRSAFLDSLQPGATLVAHQRDTTGDVVRFTVDSVSLNGNVYEITVSYQSHSGTVPWTDGDYVKFGFIPTAAGTSASGAELRLTSNQSISASTWTTVSWDAEEYDDASYWEGVTNPSRITFHEAGRYLVIPNIVFVSNQTGDRYVRVIRNGSETKELALAAVPETGADTRFALPMIVNAAAGDYVQVQVWQDTAGALNVIGAGTVGDDLETTRCFISSLEAAQPVVSSNGARMYKGTAQSVNELTDVKITWDTVDFERGAVSADTTNNRFTVAKSGLYLLTASMGYADGTGSGNTLSDIRLKYRVNGTEPTNTSWLARTGQTQADSFGYISGNTVANLTAGDYVEFHTYAVCSGADTQWDIRGGTPSHASVVMVEQVTLDKPLYPIDEKTTSDTPDDDFDSTTLDAKWTVVTGSSGTVSLTETADVNKYDLSSRAGTLLVQTGAAVSTFEMRQDYTLADGEHIITKVSPAVGNPASVANNEIFIALGVNNSDTGFDAGSAFQIGFELDANETNIKTLQTGTATYGEGQQHVTFGHPYYLRIGRAGTVYHGWFSMDGSAWVWCGSNDYTGNLADNVWLIVDVGAVLDDPVPIQAFDWIRLGTNDVDPW